MTPLTSAQSRVLQALQTQLTTYVSEVQKSNLPWHDVVTSAAAVALTWWHQYRSSQTTPGK